jgi:hypothetical protein
MTCRRWSAVGGARYRISDVHLIRRLCEPTARQCAAMGLAFVVTLTLVGSARAWSVTQRRAQESEAHQSYLHRQLADRDAVFESQRQIYMERFRRLEAQVREREQDVAALRARLVDQARALPGDRVD